MQYEARVCINPEIGAWIEPVINIGASFGLRWF
jgi:hypothetical protein